MSEFQVSAECLGLGLRAGAVVLDNVRIAPAPAELKLEIETEARRIQEQYAGRAEIRRLAEIIKLYEVLRGVGVRPRSHPPSTQRLLEYALKEGTLPAVNNLVDAYNLVSLRTRCSLGAHDLDRLSIPVQLRLFRGDEQFRPLGSQQGVPTVAGEFGYVDAANRVICRLDSRQAEFSKVTDVTSRVLLIVESTTIHSAARLEQVFDETVALVARYCGGTARILKLPAE